MPVDETEKVICDDIAVQALRGDVEETWIMCGHTKDYREFTLQATAPDGQVYEVTEDMSIWHCFRQLRKELGEENIRFLCNGSRVNFYPRTHYGKVGYLLPPRKPSHFKSLFSKGTYPFVGTFEPAPLEEIVTVAEQDAYAQRYFDS
ncbi:MAG: hypothetical protein IKS49_02405 [Actinomycetaceae bacterium]|nr:hypothetical protein [Actinomycetaceae bacterium]